jgi:hypothetical protein
MVPWQSAQKRRQQSAISELVAMVEGLADNDCSAL